MKRLIKSVDKASHVLYLAGKEVDQFHKKTLELFEASKPYLKYLDYECLKDR